MWIDKNCGDSWTRATRGVGNKRRNKNRVLLLTPEILGRTIEWRMELGFSKADTCKYGEPESFGDEDVCKPAGRAG